MWNQEKHHDTDSPRCVHGASQVTKPYEQECSRRTSRGAPARLRMQAGCLRMFLWAQQSPPAVMCSLLLW